MNPRRPFDRAGISEETKKLVGRRRVLGKCGLKFKNFKGSLVGLDVSQKPCRTVLTNKGGIPVGVRRGSIRMGALRRSNGVRPTFDKYYSLRAGDPLSLGHPQNVMVFSINPKAS